MRRGGRRGLAIGVLAAGAWVLASCDPPPEASRSERAPSPSAVPAFDGDAAYRLVERQLAFGPRIPGTEGHARTARWLEGYLRERAHRVDADRFSHEASDGRTLELVNLFARFERAGRRPILLVAHWDTRPVSDQARDPALRARPVPGANDGGSGTAILLALADLMRHHPPPRPVDLLLVDGEDYGDFRAGRDVLIGSRHFATHRAPGYLPQYGLVLDMVGDRTLALHPEGNSRRDAPAVVRRVWDLAARLGLAHAFRPEPRYTIEDDHVPLNAAGIPTAVVIDIDYAYWHTPEDTLDKISSTSLGIVGTVVTHLIYGEP